MNKEKIKKMMQMVLGNFNYGVIKTCIKVIYKINRDKEIDILSSIMNKGDICFDIGSNLGEYSYYLSRIVGKKGKVFCFEPLEDNVKVMSKVFNIFRLKNIIIINKAISNFNGQSQFSVPIKKGVFRNDLGCLVSPPNKHIENDSILKNVRVETLDTIITDYKINETKISFVKIDVEGNELNVFKGANILLSRIRPIILVEIWFEQKRRVSISKHLENYNYFPGEYINGEYHKTDLEKFKKNQINIFFFPFELSEK